MGHRLFDNKNPLFQGGRLGVLFLIKSGLMRPAKMGTPSLPLYTLRFNIRQATSNPPKTISLNPYRSTITAGQTSHDGFDLNICNALHLINANTPSYKASPGAETRPKDHHIPGWDIPFNLIPSGFHIQGQLQLCHVNM